MTLIEWIQMHLADFGAVPELIQALGIAILFILVYDFYHLLFSAVLTWFKK